MANIHSYGGSCPKCKRNILFNMHTGVLSWFSYDACPWCGFAYGTSQDKEWTQEEVWEYVLKKYNVNNREELLKRKEFQEKVTSRYSYLYPSVFTYSPSLMNQINKLNKTS